MLRALLLVVFVFLTLAACEKKATPVTHDTYIWQRQWSAAVIQAANENADVVHAWRVLGAEMSAKGQFIAVNPDFDTLNHTKKPLILVVRIDGQLPHFDQDVLVQQIEDLRQQWQRQAIYLTGIEIDYDCGTASLPAYAEFLGKLRKHKDANIALSITALPTWMSSNDIKLVLNQVDEAVIQVHAIQNPNTGLFDAKQAIQWVSEFSKITHKPFLVALPNYGFRVIWDERNRVSSVESEAKLLSQGVETQEMIASPQAVSDFLEAIQHLAPVNMVGIAWFRLPVAGDARMWQSATWRAVIKNKLPKVYVHAFLKPELPSTYKLIIENVSDIDVELPHVIRVTGSCSEGDGANGYAFTQNARNTQFIRQQNGLLRPQHQRAIGWLRCSSDKEKIDVQP